VAVVAEAASVTAQTVRALANRYVQFGLDRALYDAPRTGKPRDITDRQSQQIIAMVCSRPPEGRSRWTLELIAEESTKRKIVSGISDESVRIILKNSDFKPWREKMWCIPELDEAYIEKMEDVLNTYERPYSVKEPVVCLDEKPIQLLDSERASKPARPGKLAKTDSEYVRKGTANVFCAIEPKSGRHFTRATKNRKGREFAKMVRRIVLAYPHARKIHMVMDNLNIHCCKSLTDFYGIGEGTKLWNRLEVHHTPKHASWLNQAEIEIGIYSRQCLGKNRIPTIEDLKLRSRAWNRHANAKKLTINWKFSTIDARRKFKYKRLKT
jgi:transposase